jgi:hypothetical protein
VLQQHLARGKLDDALVRDAVSHRLEVAIDAIGTVGSTWWYRSSPLTHLRRRHQMIAAASPADGSAR